jgi:hypothetical protein
VGDGGGIVLTVAEGIGNEVSDCCGVFAGGKQVGCDTGRSGDQNSAERDPLAVVEGAEVKPHINTAGLPSRRQDELMDIGWEMSHAMK